MHRSALREELDVEVIDLEELLALGLGDVIAHDAPPELAPMAVAAKRFTFLGIERDA